MSVCIGGYEPERGVNVAGHKGYFLRDVGVLLNQALINYGTTFLRNRKYTVVQPPFFMRKEVMAGVAQLEEFDEALYKVSDVYIHSIPCTLHWIQYSVYIYIV